MESLRVPLSGAQIMEDDVDAVVRALKSGRIAMGPEIRGFEEGLAAVAGVRHAVACSSGTAALHVMLIALGVGPGDVVLTTPFSFVASSNVILMTGAVPVFVDIDPGTLGPSPEALRQTIAALRRGALRFPSGEPVAPDRLKALLLVDVFGLPAPWDAYEALAQEEGLLLLEDSCEALGSRAFGRACGSFGRAGAFAFYPNKQITTGEGGAVVTDDDEIAALCRSLVNQGRDDSGAWLAHVRLGYNYRISELTAALGRSQLSRLPAILERRREVAARYGALLGNVKGLVLPSPPSWCDLPSWFVYVVQLPEDVRRDEVLRLLSLRGVENRAYFTPIPLQPFYAERFGYRRGHFPEMDRVCARVVALPFFTDLSAEEQTYVAQSLQDVLRLA